MMAMLLGKRVVNEQMDMMEEIESTNETYFDSWPIIWKSYSEKGYTTMFNEDMSDYGLFHYQLQGFAEKPTNYYYHQYWNSIIKNRKYNQTYYCFYNTPKAKIHLDLMERHLMSMSHVLQFIFSTLSEHAHNYENDVERIDEELNQFWKRLYEGGYLNKTVIIFASDHGIRFGKIRASITGTP